MRPDHQSNLNRQLNDIVEEYIDDNPEVTLQEIELACEDTKNDAPEILKMMIERRWERMK